MIGNGEGWVTIALNDEAALKALVLAKSLKKAFTTRAIVAIVSKSGISPKILKCINEEFTGVFGFEKPTGFQDEILYAKLCCWSLPFLSKCVYLDPNCLVLSNSDELFRMEISGKISMNPEGTIFVFRPSQKSHEELVGVRNPKASFREFMEEHFGDSGISELPKSYEINIGTSNSLLAVNECDLKIVNMQGIQISKDFTLTNKSSSTGLLEKVIWKYWTELYQKYVFLEATGRQGASRIQSIFDKNSQEPIAIVGMSCRFPQSNSISEFWDVLTSGVDTVDFPKHSRGLLPISAYTLPAGFLNCPVDQFDSKFFGISPAEMTFLDPQARILLEVVWEAIEDAGISPQSLYGTQTGVFTGVWTNDYKDLQNQVTDPKEDFFRKYMGNGFGPSSGRISHLLGLCGPNIATESGCSSSMVGVDLACQNLRSQRCDLTLACGVNLVFHNYDKSLEGLIAPDGHCKVFDAAADGFGRSEGCGVLVLKRYSDALRDGDEVYGLIRGIGMSQEGNSRTMGTPTLECEAAAMRLALSNANVHPNEVNYVEAHGTGTAVGDPLEIAAIASVYSCEGRQEPLTIGSVKTNIGHTESCAGIAGIIKTLLAMKNQLIPHHVNFKTLNPSIDLDLIPARLPLDPVEWVRDTGSSAKPRIAGVSCFGISGTDAHAIIQEGPSPEVIGSRATSDLKLVRPQQVLTLSAVSDKALDDLLTKYGDYLETEPVESLADICYTANTGRSHFSHRVAIFGKTRTEIVKKISTRDFLRDTSGKVKPKLCFLFTGQGSHYMEMGRGLYKTCPTFRLYMDQCDSVFEAKYNLSILTLPKDLENLSTFLQTVYNLIPAFIVQCCLTKLWACWGVKPDYVLGHSLGEFAACVASGILTFEHALTLLMERTKLIETVTEEGKMIAIRSDRNTVGELLTAFLAENPGELIEFAAVNRSTQVVLSGRRTSIDKFLNVCQANQLSCVQVKTSQAYHCSMMSPIIDPCAEVLKKVTFSKSTCHYISAMSGKVLQDGDMDKDYFVRHMLTTVEFVEASATAFNEGCEIFLEIGPQPVLSTFILANKEVKVQTKVSNADEGQVLCLPTLRMNIDDWVVMLGSLTKLYVSGFDINWSKFDQFYPRRKVRGLPNYPFQRKKHWFENSETNSPNKSLTSFRISDKVHPLIGNLVPSVTPSKIFNTSLTPQDIPYVNDHLVGSKVLLPGAGFVEMGLTAGHLAFQTHFNPKFLDFPSNPLRLSNLEIDAPLELKDGNLIGLQTMVHQGSPSESQVSIFRLADYPEEGGSTANKWVKHATGKFSVISVSEALPENLLLSGNSIPEIERLCEEEVATQPIYDKLATLGQNFGPFFQSLKTLRRSKQRDQLLATVSFPQDSDKYFCHPVIIDAMIQAYALTKFTSMDDLHVPVNIGNFTWFAKNDKSKLAYIHSFFIPQLEDTSLTSLKAVHTVLYDEAGNLLAILSDIQLIRTSLSAIKKALEKQSMAAAVGIYQDVWRERLGPLQSRVELIEKWRGPFLRQSYYEKISKSITEISQGEKTEWILTNRLCFLYIIKAFYELGWTPRAGELIESRKLVSDLKILACHQKLVSRFLQILQEEGILQQSDQSHWTVFEIPGKAKILEEIDQVVESLEGVRYTDVLSGCGVQLGELLKGQRSISEILFTEDSKGRTPVSRIYSESCRTELGLGIAKSLLLQSILAKYLETPKEQRGILRVLEVGAGTGVATLTCLQTLEELEIKYEYTFTDLSPSFFSKGAKLLEAYSTKIEYKIFNVEIDPLVQGFAPGQFDFVFGAFVLHATKDLRESLRNIRTLTADGGAIALLESSRPTREYDMIFGLMEGYWRFEDFNVRPDHCLVGPDKWTTVLTAEDYGSVQAVDFHMDDCCILFAKAEAPAKDTVGSLKTIKGNKVPSWVIFSDKAEYTAELRSLFSSVGRRVIQVSKSVSPKRLSDFDFQIRTNEKEDMELVFRTLRDMEVLIEGVIYSWYTGEECMNPKDNCLPFLHLAQAVISSGFKSMPKIFVVTQGQGCIGDQALIHPGSSILWGMSKCFRNENSAPSFRCIDLDPEAPNLQDMFMELWKDDLEFQVSYRERKRYVRRYSPLTTELTPLNLPNVENYDLKLPDTKSIGDLTFVPMTLSRVLQDYEIEVQIEANGLNFKDVLVVLRPTVEFDTFQCLGADFSGIVTKIGPKVTKRKVGDSVFGVNFNCGSLPSHIRVPHQDLVMALPDRMTFCEAATLPIVASTAYHCLIDVANIKPSEKILIHTASGGVGLAAIQFAKAIGAEIIATAGSHRKRTYLRNLGIQHVFHSRNTNYGEEILKITGGKGVDVVLNSLTGPGFKEASLNVCAPHARFIEMSKLEIWTKEEVRALRSDVRYEIIDLTSLQSEQWTRLWAKVEGHIASGSLVPLPYERFDRVSIREALTHLRKAKHVGKVVLATGERRFENGQYVTKPGLFNDRSTYLITGGFGGVGLEVTKWMSTQGAKNLLLVGRNKPTIKAKEVIAYLNSQGKNIVSHFCDIGEFDKCEELMNLIKSPDSKLPPLRGIMHAAGTLSDALLENLTWDNFDKTFRSKVNGTWNLHTLTKGLPLEHFVLYSTVVAISGNTGQATHASANSYMDSFAFYRHSLGLPALTVNWGQWGQIGVAAEMKVTGVTPFTPAQAFTALEILMKNHKTQGIVEDVDHHLLKKVFPSLEKYFEEIRKVSTDSVDLSDGGGDSNLSKFLREYEELKDEGGKYLTVKQYVEMIVRNVLKLDVDEVVEEDMNFLDMGVDSLMMIEMKNKLQLMTGGKVILDVTALVERQTLRQMSEHIHQLLQKL